MNPVCKRLKLSPSKHQPAAAATARRLRPPRSSPQLGSHDALLLPPPPAPAGGGAQEEQGGEEEEGEGYLLVEEDTTDSSLIITMEDSQVAVKAARRRAGRKKKRKLTEGERGGASESEEEEAAGPELEIDRQLDQSLETKSKQHNLTTVNVRNIIHEVITNEHVVAMMKAAINETEAVPPFEPKMTRSKFKEVVEKGVVIPAWNISPIKKTSDVNKAPQFVDIPLAEEDSSDEEYRPDEEEEDETAEDTFLESDMESTASSPRGSRLSRVEEDSCSPWQCSSRSRSRRLRAGSASMGPPPPPKAPPPKAVTDSTFLEKLHAVEEELAVCLEPYQVGQALPESEEEVGLMAYRTRSKRPLRDVPLGRLEAELRAPDITPDMYDSSSAPEDRDWTDWLRGLMTSDMENEEECDDEDDPEYNFLADIDEPDVEDYRDDKAVRITKKEVNELMEELFETLKEDLAGQEVEDEGHEEEEEPQEEAVHTHTAEEHSTGPGNDGPITERRTVKQQLALMRTRQQTHTLCNTHTHCPEPYTLKLNAQQKSRLQQQLQQHVQLLTQIHLLSSPVVRLQSEAETTRQFLFELQLLAQRGEMLLSSGRPSFCSVFRASNLQAALQLLDELRAAPVSHQTQLRPPDARGHMRCHPVLPAELAWLFATRPVFLYPELLPCSSLDPALYCPRRTTAFTAAEDCLLVLGLRNMDGASDPTKLVSQFLLRKTLVQVRRRILQCCRPGVPDNIVKAFRYQRVLWPMLVACRGVDPAEQRRPVEREEAAMPPWLLRSLPVIYPTIRDYNRPPGSAPAAPRPCRSGGALLRPAPDAYSFPPGTRYPPRLPKHLDFRRIGFVQQQPLPRPRSDPAPLPRSGPAPVPDGQVDSSSPRTRPLSPPRVLRRLLLSRTDTPADIATATASAVSTTIRERIRRHYQTLAGLRRRRSSASPPEEESTVAPPPAGPAPSQGEELEEDDVIRTDGEEEEEEEEEESEVLLVLSESSPSSAGSDLDDHEEEAESESEQEVTRTSRADDDDDDDQRRREDEAFAQDYLLRVCDAAQATPGVSEQLLQVLDRLSAASAALLYDGLSGVLRPWPQLLRDFAAFLNPQQARRCGLLTEQQLFERSRRFLRRLGRSLGEGSSLYQQVVSVLQGGSAPSAEDMDEVSSLLGRHSDLQEEFWEFFKQLHGRSLPVATSSKSTETDSESQNPRDGNRKRVERREDEESATGSDGQEEAESERPVGAKNISMTSTGEKVVVWTREADRAILTACQQRGANRKTFRQVSAQLGNKTAQQVSLRFHDLMSLFHSAFQKSTSCSSERQPISRQKAALD